MKNVASRMESIQNLQFYRVSELYEREFFSEEMNQLKYSFRRCLQTAVMLPTYLGHRFVKELQCDIYRGAETYYEMNLAFYMNSTVSPAVSCPASKVCGKVWALEAMADTFQHKV